MNDHERECEMSERQKLQSLAEDVVRKVDPRLWAVFARDGRTNLWRVKTAVEKDEAAAAEQDCAWQVIAVLNCAEADARRAVKDAIARVRKGRTLAETCPPSSSRVCAKDLVPQPRMENPPC